MLSKRAASSLRPAVGRRRGAPSSRALGPGSRSRASPTATARPRRPCRCRRSRAGEGAARSDSRWIERGTPRRASRCQATRRSKTLAGKLWPPAKPMFCPSQSLEIIGSKLWPTEARVFARGVARPAAFGRRRLAGREPIPATRRLVRHGTGASDHPPRLQERTHPFLPPWSEATTTSSAQRFPAGPSRVFSRRVLRRRLVAPHPYPVVGRLGRSGRDADWCRLRRSSRPAPPRRRPSCPAVAGARPIRTR